MNVEQLLEIKGISFTEAGGDLIIPCLNPDHVDENPSLRIDRETGVMHCLACGFGKGIPSIFHYFNKGIERSTGKLARVRRIIREITTSSALQQIPESALMFKEEYRGIRAETFEKYFAFTQQSEWEHRLVFPITNPQGGILAFLGRTMLGDAKPKYMVKPREVPLPVFPVRVNEPVLILVEGIFDMLNMEDKGLTNVSCIFGTHQFSFKTVQDKLMPFELAGTRVVVILLDNDKSGNDSASLLSKMIRDKTNLIPIVANQFLPIGKDPGDLTLEEIEVLQAKIDILVAEELNS